MSESKEAKKVLLEEIKDKLSRAKNLVLVDYTGINVEEVTALRVSCRNAGVDYKVYKNTLVAKAAEELGIEGLDSYLTGANAFAFSYDDVVAPAKIMYEFNKTSEKCPIKCGYMDGKPISAEDEIALAKLPGKDALIVQLIWTLQGNVRNLAYALNAIKEKMEA
ncbi:MAG: 50S ribosomal protein L10 [Clostridia bacterium]|nr:50S ribosomal protein L10 [Clostridia bacterium]